MRITVQLPDIPNAEQDVLFLDVGPDMTIDDFKAVIAIDSQTAPIQQALYWNGNLLADGAQTLADVGIKDADMVLMQIRRPAASGRDAARRQAQGQPAQNDAERLRLQALEDPGILERLRHQRPELAEAVHDPRQFREVWNQLIRAQNEREDEKNRLIARLNADPFDIEAQREIEEMIRKEAVMQNLHDTMENMPEAFGRVHMLYIPVEVNGVNVKAFVDSGAQATIMSPSCAEQCNIMRLLDTSFAGMARGVGTAKILGRVHSAMIKIGTLHLPCSFTVMEGKDVDLLLGLDMLKRHQACIDLRKGALVVGEDEIPFLGEADIPKMPSWFGEEPTVEGPAGTQIGGRSGAVIAPSVDQSVGSRPGEVAGGSQADGGPVSGAAPTSQRLTSPQTQVPAGSGQRSGSYPPGHVNQLMELGFSREEVLRALEMAGGNLDVAAGILYQ